MDIRILAFELDEFIDNSLSHYIVFEFQRYRNSTVINQIELFEFEESETTNISFIDTLFIVGNIFCRKMRIFMVL